MQELRQNETRQTEETELLKAELQKRLGNRVRGLEIELRDQGLILHGVTCTWYAKQMAQHALLQVTGRRLLANNIIVKTAKGPGGGSAEPPVTG